MTYALAGSVFLLTHYLPPFIHMMTTCMHLLSLSLDYFYKYRKMNEHTTHFTPKGE